MSNSLKITGCRNVYPADNSESLIGYIDVEFNNCLVINGFKIFKKKDSDDVFFVKPPQRWRKKTKNWADIVYFTKESGVSKDMYAQILKLFEENVSKSPV